MRDENTVVIRYQTLAEVAAEWREQIAFTDRPTKNMRKPEHPVEAAERRYLAAQARADRLAQERREHDEALAAQIAVNSPEWPA